jgi:hypothetical protein
MLTMLENAVADRYLNPKLEADATIADVEFHLRTSTTNTPQPKDRATVLVIASEGPVRITGLHDCVIDIQVGMPMDVELAAGRDPVEQIALLEKAVERAFSKTTHASAKSEFNAAIAAEDSDYSGGDFFAKGWRTERDEAEVKQLYSVDCGVLASGL